MRKTFKIFLKYRKQMQEMQDAGDFVTGADKYFHCKANYEAARWGLWFQFWAFVFSWAKEIYDVPKKVLFQGMPFTEAIADSKADLEADREGRIRAEYRWLFSRKDIAKHYTNGKMPEKYL